MSINAELVVTALQQRIGEIVSNYELQIALIRAELTEALNALSELEESKEKAVADFEQELANKLSSAE